MPIQTPWDLRLDIDGTSFANRAQENDEALANSIPSNAASLWTPVTKTTNYTANGTELVNASSSITITSPSVAAGRTFAVFTSGGTTTVTASGSSKFFGPGLQSGGTYGVASMTVGLVSYVEFLCDGNNWVATSANGNAGWVTIGNGSMANSWVTASETVQYTKTLADGMVHLRGSIKNGTVGTVAFTFPAGFRPAQQFVPPVGQAGQAFSQLVIGTGGATLAFTSVVTTTELFLDGVAFLAEL